MVGNPADLAFEAFRRDGKIRGRLEETKPLHGPDLVKISGLFEQHVRDIITGPKPINPILPLSDLIVKKEHVHNFLKDLYFVDLVLAGELW